MIFKFIVPPDEVSNVVIPLKKFSLLLIIYLNVIFLCFQKLLPTSVYNSSQNYILIFGVIGHRYYYVTLASIHLFINLYSALFIVTRVFATKLDLSLIYFFSFGHR